MRTVPESPMRGVPDPEWRRMSAAHEQVVDELLAGHRERSYRHEKHPVEDFLFTYYSHRPGHLRRWHPGIGVALGGDADWHLTQPGYVHTEAGVTVDPRQLSERSRRLIRSTHRLLTVTAGRQPRFGCFGLHEWAMVYRQPADRRHDSIPLRLGSEGTDAVVESLPIRCSHFDAFRFFTDEARPLNAIPLSRESTVDNEQPGCLHATMDLYRWAYTLLPLTPSELLIDCFRLAFDSRTLDMRASPYDLSSYGYSPVPIETPAGRRAYSHDQAVLADRATPLRQRLIEVAAAGLLVMST